MKKCKLGFVIVVVLLLAGANNAVRGEVITVPDDYPSIGEAVSNALPGDTIMVESGVYTEDIRIDKRLTLECEDVTLKGKIIVDAKNVKISNIRIQDVVEAVEITSSEGAVLYSLSISNCTYGVKVERNGEVDIRSSSFENCEYGVHGNKTKNIQVSGATFTNNINGLYFTEVHSSSVASSQIKNSTTGVYFTLSERVSISKNVIEGCETGIELQETDGTIEDNFLKNDTNIKAESMDNSTISGNTIEGGTKGIILKYSSGNEIRANRIKNAGSWGIRIMYQSQDCKFYNNLLYNNKSGIEALAGCDNTKIVNNTLYKNSKNIWIHDSKDILIQNNIITKGDYGIYAQESNATVNYNNFSKTPKPGYITGIEIEKYNSFEDPMFMDVENENFKLDINSPCVDFGKLENSPGTDFEGKGRPYGEGVDLGAYEVTSAQITLITNTVDYELADEFINFLDKNNVHINAISAEDFPEHQEDKIIVILGGPDAYVGVGYIVQIALDPNEITLLRKEGNSAMFIKTNTWKDDQLILILAGNDRDLTQKASLENKEEVLSQIKEWT